MRSLKFALLALAASFMFQGVTAQSASALNVPKPAVAEKQGLTLVRHGHRHHWRHHGFRRHGYHRRWHGPRIYIGPSYGYRSYGYRSYGYSCRWLKRKALWTGSSYWWRRYNRCRYGW